LQQSDADTTAQRAQAHGKPSAPSARGPIHDYMLDARLRQNRMLEVAHKRPK